MAEEATQGQTPETEIKPENTGEMKFEQLPESWQSEIKKLRNEAAGNRVKSKELEDKLTALEQAEKERQSIVEKEAAEALAKKGEYEKLYEAEKAKNETAKTELEALRAENKVFKEKAQKDFESELNKLPEDKREIYKSAPIEVLRDAASLYDKDKAPHSPGSEQHSETSDMVVKAEGTGNVLEELVHIAKNNPKGYEEWANKK